MTVPILEDLRLYWGRPRQAGGAGKKSAPGESWEMDLVLDPGYSPGSGPGAIGRIRRVVLDGEMEERAWLKKPGEDEA